MRVIKTIVVMAGVLLSLGFSQARALVVVPISGEAPNYYVCNGKNASLVFYDKSYINNTTLLELTIDKTKYSFSGKDIQSQTTPMGRLKSVAYKILPDVQIKKASVIIPDIRLGSNGFGPFLNDAIFSSQLILTTIQTPFTAQAYIGIIDSSSFIGLSCKASLVFVPIQ